MALYEEQLRIAQIAISICSDHPFCLSERCEPFRASVRTPDVVFRLQGADAFPADGLQCLHRGEKRAVWRRGDTLFYAGCSPEEAVPARWFTRWQPDRPGEYEVSVLAEEVWGRVNPLTFAELSEFLIRHDAMVLHSSLIRYQGKGIVFTAPSQTGKSTQARLWQQYRGAEILNGDRSLIRHQGNYRAYGSPYAGSSAIYRNESAPLTAIVVLRQAKTNTLRRLDSRQACLYLLSQLSLSPYARDVVEAQSRWLLALLEQVPVYRLDCLPDEGAVDLLYQQLWKEDGHDA